MSEAEALLCQNVEEQVGEGAAGPPKFRELKNFPIVLIESVCQEKVFEQIPSMMTFFGVGGRVESDFEQRSDSGPAR